MTSDSAKIDTHSFDAYRLQHLIIRVYIGIDFVHHFAEKFGLLGAPAQEAVLRYFEGVSPPGQASTLLLLAGLCEFGAFIGFTFGLFTRWAAVGTALYLVIASIMGGHFDNGFTWANPGGGWEYPLLWTVLCLSFVLTGGGRFSVDAWARRHTGLPRWLIA